MIYKNTYLIPADSCGVLWVKTIHLYGGSFSKTAKVGNFIKISVSDTSSNNSMKKKLKISGIMISTKKEILSKDNTSIKFKQNNVVLLKRSMTPVGMEVFGPMSELMKRQKFKSSFAKIV